MAGCRQIYVGNNERSEEPSDQTVEWCQERQPTQQTGHIRPTLHPPHQRAGSNLQGQEHVQNGKIGCLLQWIELSLWGLLKGMPAAFEDISEIIFDL